MRTPVHADSLSAGDSSLSVVLIGGTEVSPLAYRNKIIGRRLG